MRHTGPAIVVVAAGVYMRAFVNTHTDKNTIVNKPIITV